MTQEILPEALDRAYTLFSELIAGHWAEAHQELDARLRGEVPAPPAPGAGKAAGRVRGAEPRGRVPRAGLALVVSTVRAG